MNITPGAITSASLAALGAFVWARWRIPINRFFITLGGIMTQSTAQMFWPAAVFGTAIYFRRDNTQ